MNAVELAHALRERGNADIADGYEDKSERGHLDLEAASMLERLIGEAEALRALAPLNASLAQQVTQLENEAARRWYSANRR